MIIVIFTTTTLTNIAWVTCGIRTKDTLNAKSWGLVQRKTRILAEDS